MVTAGVGIRVALRLLQGDHTMLYFPYPDFTAGKCCGESVDLWLVGYEDKSISAGVHCGYMVTGVIVSLRVTRLKNVPVYAGIGLLCSLWMQVLVLFCFPAGDTVVGALMWLRVFAVEQGDVPVPCNPSRVAGKDINILVARVWC